jgi:hypothetical protein
MRKMKTRKEVEEVEEEVEKLIYMLKEDNEEVKRRKAESTNIEFFGKIYDILIEAGEKHIAKFSLVLLALKWVLGENEEFKKLLDEYVKILEEERKK